MAPVLAKLTGMWMLAALVSFLIGAVATFTTGAFLLLTLTPQDSGVSATGDWEVAIFPGVIAALAFGAGVVFWRRV